MLSYILLFALIALVILGVIRASKQKQPGSTRPQREPFVGVAQDEMIDEIEMVSEARVIKHAREPVFTALADDPQEDIQENAVEIRQSPITSQKPVASALSGTTSGITEVPPLFAAKPDVVEEENPVNDVIVLHVVANPENPYRGYELLQAILTAGLRYGKWNIFHRHEEITGRGPILFSLASSVNPGTFDLAKMGNFSTPGLTLFMRLSNLEHPAQAFEILLSAAVSLTGELGGTVCDEKRSALSPEKIAILRAQLQH